MSTKKPSRHREHVLRAVNLIGSQGKLAKLLGISQQGVSYFLYRADQVTAEMAKKIELATNGKVSRAQLRPDLFRGVKPIVKKSKKTPSKKRTASLGAAGEETSQLPPTTSSPV